MTNQPSEELKPSTVKRFLSKIKPNGDCLEWQGYCLKKRWSNYGIITMNRKQYRVHRFSWLISHGHIPKDSCVLHKCDNQRCVNPDHLFLGSLIDNNLDRDKKGRNKIVYGSKNGLSKLDEISVKYIKSQIGIKSFAELGRRFNVKWQTIQTIAKGRTWKSV